MFEVTPANNGLNLDDLPKLAGEIGLNSSTLKTCLDGGKNAAHFDQFKVAIDDLLKS